MRRTIVPALSVLSIAALLSAGCAGREDTSMITAGKAPWETGGASTTAPNAAAPGGAAGGLGTATAALAAAEIVDPAAKSLGTASVRKAEHGLAVQVSVRGLPPGFHGLHVHAIGKCEPKSADPANPAMIGDFLSAGGHLVGGGPAHPDHAGDLPVLYVGADGTGSLTAITDRLTEAELNQQGGLSLIVHANANNYANIPTRYATGGADAETKKAGDAGARIGCGVLKKTGAA